MYIKHPQLYLKIKDFSVLVIIISSYHWKHFQVGLGFLVSIRQTLLQRSLLSYTDLRNDIVPIAQDYVPVVPSSCKEKKIQINTQKNNELILGFFLFLSVVAYWSRYSFIWRGCVLIINKRNGLT